MASITVEKIVHAPVSEVWAAWDDFGGIHRFNPNLSGSHLLEGSAKTGLGATRQCDLIDGKNYIQERVVDYVPNKRMVIDIFDGTIPVRNARAEIELHEKGERQTEVTMTMHFQPKMGIFGQLMVPLMKPQFRKLLAKLLDGNAAYVEKARPLAA